MLPVTGQGQFDLQSILRTLGFSEREGLVYKTFLDGTSRPASSVSKQAGLKRGQTYDVLSDLEQKGVVQEFTRGNTRYFSASPPNSLFELFEDRQRELAKHQEGVKNLAAHLSKHHDASIRHPRVCYFQGPDGIKQIFDDMIQTPNTEIFLIIDTNHLIQTCCPELAVWIDEWKARRVERDIWSYGIYSKTPVGDERLKQPGLKRKLKAFSGYNLPIQINVYRNKVALLSAHSDLSGVVIEDMHHANTMRGLHQLLWQFLPDYFPEAIEA